MEMKLKHRLIGVGLVVVFVAGIAGCAKDPYRSSGRVLDDRMVKTRVKGALNNSPVYKFPHVDVITYNGTVQLNGFVHRDEQKAVAAEMARGIDGVRDVINNISIIPQEPAYGGTVDPKTGVRGTGGYYPTTPRATNQNSRTNLNQ
jgi:hyperosmotically inducible periplasmic protein